MRTTKIVQAEDRSKACFDFAVVKPIFDLFEVKIRVAAVPTGTIYVLSG